MILCSKKNGWGWIAGEDPKRDEEMMEAVIEVLAEVSQQIWEGQLNPFK